MKYLLQLALAAMTLFSISAALSLWLNQPRQTAATPPTADAGSEKLRSQPPEKEKEKEPRPLPKADPAVSPPGPDLTAAGRAAALDREARMDRRQAQMGVVARDLVSEREAVDALVRQVAAEVARTAARASERATEVEAKSADAQKKTVELDAVERKNIERMATMYDSMAPESAAPILKQMADSGRMDTAVKILAQMKERSAARVLAELSDPTLAAQLLDKMRLLKRPAISPPAPAP